MSRAKTSLAALALVLGACAASPDPQSEAEAEYARAVEEAMRPATEEEIAAANRADPLTKANFWAKEHAKDPDNLENALAFASALRGIGSDERAVEVLSQILIVHPGDAEVLMALGRALAAQNNASASARAFDQATRVAPERADTWAALGTALDQLDRHNDAQAAYDKALLLEPDRTSTLANYGLSLALSGNLIAAEAKLRQAAALPDADLRVMENLALILGLQGKYEEMAAVSSSHAPKGVVEQNARLLRDMIQPVRTWESLTSGKGQTGTAPSAPLPQAEPVPQPVPGAETSGTLAGSADAEDDRATPGLRLRRSDD